MTKHIVNLCCILGIALAVSCSTPRKRFDQGSLQLTPNTTIEEALNILGPPTSKELREDGHEIYHYGPARFLDTYKGKIISFGKLDSVEPMDTPIGPLKALGIACEKDMECQTQNCHMFKKVCAGKNNCTMGIGAKHCGSDTDCCDGVCDFGTCRKR